MLWGSRLKRITQVLLILVLLALSFPRPAAASSSTGTFGGVVLHFNVIAVTKDTSVSVRTTDFPLRTKFTVRMDVVGKQGIDGIVVGELYSEKGGELEATFSIPAELQGKIILALRIESKDGYYAYSWFFNETAVNTLPDPKAKPEVTFADAKKGEAVTVQAKNLPANTSFWVRVGPYYTFYRDYASTDRVTSGSDGTVSFNLPIPKSMQSADYLMVRLDGGGKYAYNVYKNVDNGAVVTESSLYKVVECQLISLNRIPPLAPGEEFDVVWTVQNTGLADWDAHHVMFLYAGGTKMHKYKDKQTLPYSIQRGWVHDFALDMRAPKETGWYRTTWVVKQVANGEKTLCTLNVSVYVQ